LIADGIEGAGLEWTAKVICDDGTEMTAQPPFGNLTPNRLQSALLRVAQSSKLKRGAFRPTVSRILHAIRPGPIDSTFRGANFRFYHRDNGTECGALLNPAYNTEELDFLRQHVPIGGTFVDVGANIGLYSAVIAKHVGPAGRAMAIEPHPVALQRLAFNCEASGLANVEIVRAAAAPENRELLIETDSGNLGGSRIGQNDKGIVVAGIPLLEILTSRNVANVDGLKIDVEGFEDRVLTGFFKSAPRALWPGAVVIEHLSRSEWEHDCIENMLARGYQTVGRTRSNTLLILGTDP
jgi:FkbM family methyltransferase